MPPASRPRPAQPVGVLELNVTPATVYRWLRDRANTLAFGPTTSRMIRAVNRFDIASDRILEVVVLDASLTVDGLAVLDNCRFVRSTESA